MTWISFILTASWEGTGFAAKAGAAAHSAMMHKLKGRFENKE